MNLRRDPLLSSTVEALDALSQAQPAIRRIQAARADSPPALLQKTSLRLARASALLSGTHFQDIEKTLDAVATTAVSAEALRRLLESVAAEKRLPAPAMPVKGLPEGAAPPWRVRVPPNDWETIWRNIFANTLTALRAARGTEPRLALFVAVARDSVTAEAVVRFAFADNAPGVLTTEMIQGRAADRGWGVVAELIRAHRGSIVVASSVDRQYTKRVLIELSVAETR